MKAQSASNSPSGMTTGQPAAGGLPPGATSTPPVTVSTDELSGYAASHANAAARLAAHTAPADIASLAPTFGMIGADFLAALAQVLDSRRRRLSALTLRHRAIAEGTASAAGRYTATDADSATALGVPA